MRHWGKDALLVLFLICLSEKNRIHCGSSGTPATTINGVCTMGSTTCEDAIANSECLASTCRCLDGFIEEDSTTCTKVVLGLVCNGREDICNHITNAECDSACTCKAGYSGSHGTSMCASDPTVRCSMSDTSMTIELRVENDAAHQQIVTYKEDPDTNGLTTSKCKINTVTTTSGGSFLELKITVDENRDQTSPDISTSDCFVIKDDSEVNVLVVGQAVPGIIQHSDRFYNAVCDTTTANGDVVTIEDIGITSSIEPYEKTTEADDIRMELLDSDELPILSSEEISIGSEVKLKVTMNRAAVPTAPLGIFLHTLVVSADLMDTTTKQMTMLDQHGCIEEGGSVFKPATTFVPVSTTMDPRTDTEYAAITGKFQLALFEGMATSSLIFTVKYEASCYDDTENKCFNLQAYCTEKTSTQPIGATRRRRSARNVKNGTVTLEVGGSDIKSIQESKPSPYIWMGAVVLGCLVLTSVLVAVVLIRRTRREKRRSEKLENMSGAHNPVF